MLLVVELIAIDDAAAAQAARILDAYLETLFEKGLLKYRIGRQLERHARLILFEEWTNVAAHDASQSGNPVFDSFRRELAPLLAESPRACEYEIVAAAVGAE